ncbi:MAG: hypothetical protein A2147_00965 [Chloroflexi bacterium RBG_16_57_8]|nr:MAG: hypothetical protein A2147_00965 [Chloroflexi bacterium RBG_16_57_8]
MYSYGTNTWYAMYYSGDRWLTAESQNLGYSEYDYALNGGEVYTDYGDHPSFPSTTTDSARLYLNGWTVWDWQRWATTNLIQTPDTTYDVHTSTNYYNFYIHKH